ncbi:cysteine dioxygenase [Actinoallomurus rhizosphaericola]|uniref:cysteine dioxygenase n=1 Tax=Actinoallomurus rhizosphaericola TaxID=2952536 RepID=UPI0020931662|nr:cysteine dioxygenase family protein [Actinoallomurus rhizosphaericola]MCO5997200.1 cysteine dioxygenase family protein [Actinoallomurus rhizosphaericola]
MPASTSAPARTRLADVARRLAAAPDEWIHRVRLSTEERWYERLHQDDDHEIWLLSWLPGQSTGFHDHGGSRGAFAVALGSLREHDLTVERDLGPGDVREFGRDYIHSVTNASAAPAVSVHVYSPRLTVMNRYDLVDGTLIKLVEESADDW